MALRFKGMYFSGTTQVATMYLWVSRNFRSKYRYINPGAQYFSRDHGAGVNGRKKNPLFPGKQQKKIPPFSKKQWDFLSAVLDE